MLIQIYKNGQSLFIPAHKDKNGNLTPITKFKKQTPKTGGAIIKEVPIVMATMDPIKTDESRKRRIQSLIERL